MHVLACVIRQGPSKGSADRREVSKDIHVKGHADRL